MASLCWAYPGRSKLCDMQSRVNNVGCSKRCSASRPWPTVLAPILPGLLSCRRQSRGMQFARRRVSLYLATPDAFRTFAPDARSPTPGVKKCERLGRPRRSRESSRLDLYPSRRAVAAAAGGLDDSPAFYATSRTGIRAIATIAAVYTQLADPAN